MSFELYTHKEQLMGAVKSFLNIQGAKVVLLVKRFINGMKEKKILLPISFIKRKKNLHRQLFVY
jgi:ribosomal 30S subunit maturation factor RimM